MLVGVVDFIGRLSFSHGGAGRQAWTEANVYTVQDIG